MSATSSETAEIIFVTPEQAQEMLATSLGNRALSRERVEEHKMQLRAGQWFVTSNGLGFGFRGNLIDGHHRLTACVETGIGFRTLIVRGLSDAACDKIDKGRPRSLRQSLIMRNETQATAKASYLRACTSMLLTEPVAIRFVDVYDRWMEVFGDSVRWAIDVFGHTPFRAASIGGVMAFVHRIRPELAVEFGVKVAEGADLRVEEPAWTCRRYLTTAIGTNALSYPFKRPQDSEAAIKLCNAVFAHMNGTKTLCSLHARPAGMEWFIREGRKVIRVEVEQVPVHID